MTDCTFPRCGCSEREQCRPEDALKAALARAEAAEAEVKKLTAGNNWLQKQFHENLENLVKETDRAEAAERQRDEAIAASDARAEAMREACAAAIEKRAVEIGRQECCGFGLSSPPECCADPLWMISSQDGAAAIRALPIPAQEVK